MPLAIKGLAIMFMVDWFNLFSSGSWTVVGGMALKNRTKLKDDPTDTQQAGALANGLYDDGLRCQSKAAFLFLIKYRFIPTKHELSGVGWVVVSMIRTPSSLRWW